MEVLGLAENSMVVIRSRQLPKATYVKFRPMSKVFYDFADQKATYVLGAVATGVDARGSPSDPVTSLAARLHQVGEASTVVLLPHKRGHRPIQVHPNNIRHGGGGAETCGTVNG
jgi:hypothetical protein